DILLAELAGEIADRRFERGLRDTHDVVVREHALAAQVGERQDAAAAALLHQRHDRSTQRDEGVRAYVESNAKTLARRLDEWIAQLGLRRKCGAVHEEVEAAK